MHRVTTLILALALTGCATSHEAAALTCSTDACGTGAGQTWECEIPEAGYRNTFCAYVGAPSDEIAEYCARSCWRAGTCDPPNVNAHEPLVYPCGDDPLTLR